MERCSIYDFTLCECAVQEKWNMSDVSVIGPSAALWIAPVVYRTLSDKHTYSLVKNIGIKGTVLTGDELLKYFHNVFTPEVHSKLFTRRWRSFSSTLTSVWWSLFVARVQNMSSVWGVSETKVSCSDGEKSQVLMWLVTEPFLHFMWLFLTKYNDLTFTSFYFISI